MLAFEADGSALPQLPDDSGSDVSDESDSDGNMSICTTDETNASSAALQGGSSSFSTPVKAKPSAEALQALSSAGFDADKMALEEADSDGDGAVEVVDVKCPVTDARSEVHRWGWCPWRWRRAIL